MSRLLLVADFGEEHSGAVVAEDVAGGGSLGSPEELGRLVYAMKCNGNGGKKFWKL